MPFFRPTRPELYDQATQEINALIPEADARLPFGILNVFAVIWAGLADGLHTVLQYLSRQFFAHLADAEYLVLIGKDYGIYRKAAAKASGQVVVTGNVGAILPIGTVLRRSDGTRYITNSGVTIPALGTATVQVIAEKLGLVGNAPAGVVLTPTTTQAGITSIVVGQGTLAGGAEVESDEQLRERILFRRRNPPGAGTKADWLRWAFEFPGVTRAWVRPLIYGYGTLGLYFALDDAGIIPSATSVQQMQTFLDDNYTPMGSKVYVMPITFEVVPFTINELPNGKPEIREAIINELRDLLYREGGPGQTIPISHITEAISGAAGEYDHFLISPTTPIVVPEGKIAQLGAVTWV